MDEWSGRKREPITEERLVRAIDVLLEIAKEHGPSVTPLVESLTQQLADFRQRHLPDDHAGGEQLRKAG